MSDFSLRDFLAAQAMQAMLGPFLIKELDEVDPNGWMEGISYDSYAMADAMMKARDEK